MKVVEVPEFCADTVLGDVDVRTIVSLTRPPDGSPDAPGCHLEPRGTGGCPGVVLIRSHVLVGVEVHLADVRDLGEHEEGGVDVEAEKVGGTEDHG